MGTRSDALASQFEQEVNDLVKAVEGASDEQWRAICGDEKWTVAGTAHHVAAQWPLEKEYLDAAAGFASMPGYTWDDINGKNETRAQANSAIGKAEVAKMLREGSATMAAYVRGLSDEQLDRKVPLPLADGAEVSTQQLIEGGVLIDHARGHLKSIRSTG